MLSFEQGTSSLFHAAKSYSNCQQNLATENLTLFLHCFSKGHEALQQIALQTITDILITHPSLLSQPNSTTGEEEAEPNPFIKPTHKLYSRAISSPSVQLSATATIGLSKLLLTQILPYPDDLLKTLTLAFLDPETETNSGMRQALSYFLPVYCHSRAENAVRMARLAVSIIGAVIDRVEEEEVDLDGGKEGIGAVAVGGMLSDWCDPRKVVGADEGKEAVKEDGLNAHAALAEEILEKLLTPGTSSKYLYLLQVYHLTNTLYRRGSKAIYFNAFKDLCGAIYTT